MTDYIAPIVLPEPCEHSDKWIKTSTRVVYKNGKYIRKDVMRCSMCTGLFYMDSAVQTPPFVCERHNSIIVYKHRLRDLFQQTFWLRCVRCMTEQGPYPTKSIALLRKASE